MQRHAPIHEIRHGAAVRDHQQAAAGAAHQVAEQAHDLETGGFVEVTGGFVRQHQRRLCNSARAMATLLLLSARQLLRKLVELVAEAEPFDEFVFVCGVLAAAERRLEANVVDARSGSRSGGIAGTRGSFASAAVRPVRFSDRVHGDTVEVNLAGVRPIEPGDRGAARSTCRCRSHPAAPPTTDCSISKSSELSTLCRVSA